MADLTRRELVARIHKLESENLQLRAERLQLAKLSAESPQFDNPFQAWDAKELRNTILAEKSEWSAR